MTKRTILINLQVAYETELSMEELKAQIEGRLDGFIEDAVLDAVVDASKSDWKYTVNAAGDPTVVNGIKHWDTTEQPGGQEYSMRIYDNRRTSGSTFVEVLRPNFGFACDADGRSPGEESGLSLCAEVSSSPINGDHVPHISVGTPEDAMLHLYFLPEGILVERDNDLTRIEVKDTKRGRCELYCA